LERLRLVLGTSMGGMHTWMWGERYPDMMDALLPIASLPERVVGRNLLWRRLLIKLVQVGEDERRGASTQQPPSLGLAWNVFELMVGSPASLTSVFGGPGDADNHIESVAEEALKREKANDVIWEFDASRDYDPSAGLGLIQAPLLAVNFADDALNPVELGGLEGAITQVKDGRAVTVPVGPKSRGHQTPAGCRGLAGLCAATAATDGTGCTEALAARIWTRMTHRLQRIANQGADRGGQPNPLHGGISNARVAVPGFR
jgi:homoserine O-acetyltransferase